MPEKFSYFSALWGYFVMENKRLILHIENSVAFVLRPLFGLICACMGVFLTYLCVRMCARLHLCVRAALDFIS